jgi:hypothetical protein
MLSAALDEALLGDPNTSVDDIVGILSIVLNMQGGKQGSSSSGAGLQEPGAADMRQPQPQMQGTFAWQQSAAAPEPAAAAMSMPSPEAFLASAEKLLGLPPGMVQDNSPAPAAAAAGSAGSSHNHAVRSSREQRGRSGDGSNSDGLKETASEMAARLLEQARLMHAKAAAHAGSSQAAAAAGQPTPASGVAQQAARDSMRAWQAEGGLMYKHSSGGSSFKAAVAGLDYSAGSGSPSSAGGAVPPGVGSASRYLGNLQQQQQQQVSRVSPLSARGRSSGSYAGRLSARRSMSPHAAASQQQQGDGEPRMVPAEVERAWRQGLRSPERDAGAAAGASAAQGSGGAGRGAAQGSEGLLAGGAGAGAILEGFDGSGGPQEWAGYDGLMGLRQQQRKAGRGGGSSGGGAGRIDPDDVNSYRARQTPELDAKLQRLYQRNVDWRQRCEVVYARQRYAEVASELQECTFQPEINKKSQQLVQVSRWWSDAAG